MFLNYFEQITDKTVNLSIGSIILSSERFRTYSVSFPYFYSPLVYAIPQGRVYTSLEKLVFPFRYRIWIGVAVLLLSVAFLTFILKFLAKKIRDFVFGSNNSAPLLNAVNICLGNAQYQSPRRNFARTMLLIMLFTWFVLRNAYTGTLFGFLQREQRMSPLYTMKDVSEATNNIYVRETLYQDIYDSWEEARHRFVRYVGDISSLDKYKDGSFDGIMMIGEEVVDYYNLKNFPNFKVLKTKEHINQVSYSIYFYKHSCLTREFNRQIHLYTSNGFVEVWTRGFTKTYRMNYKADGSARKAISFNQINGLIIVCAFMYLISFIIFAFELMSSKHDSIKRIMDFFTFKH